MYKTARNQRVHWGTKRKKKQKENRAINLAKRPHFVSKQL